MKISAQVALFVSLAAGSAFGQTVPQPAAELIRHLTYQSDRRDEHGMFRPMVFTCGSSLAEDRDHRALAKSLVNMGTSAVPAIERALDSLEARDGNPPAAINVEWLLLAYARIMGPAAFVRLNGMHGLANLGDYAGGLDQSVAVAFNLTSYVSAYRGMSLRRFHSCALPNSDSRSFGPDPCVAPSVEVPTAIMRCDRSEEPRDALDQLILAWETSDGAYLEASLGPRAKTALEELLRGRTWAAMRAQFWPSDPEHNVAVGYRFAISGPWSEPEETLEDERGRGQRDEQPVNPEIETLFMTSTGGKCGRLPVAFSETPVTKWSWGPVKYSVDNPNLADLLRLIATCAVVPAVSR